MSDEEDRRDRDVDPEVLADLQLRANSERDRGRSRVDPTINYSRPNVVTHWKCRHPRCSTMVPICNEGAARLGEANAYLLQRHERPIPDDAIVVCDEHRLEVNVYRAQKMREKNDRLRDVIRKIKECKDPRRETALIAKLQADHHPDVEGLLQAIESRLAAKGDKRGDKL